MDVDAKQRVQKQFGETAQKYVESAGHAHGNDLKRMLELAAPQGHERVLDIATGGGHTALAFAPYVRDVVASDLTEAMLHAAEAFVRGKGITNVSFEHADAEALPFDDNSFDYVTVRIAPHHFPNPSQFIREVARVLRPGGMFVFDDNIAPEDHEQAALLNLLEQKRDPSHVRCLPISEWVVLMRAAGLRVEHSEVFARKTQNFAEWTARSNMPAHERVALEAWLLAAPAHIVQPLGLEIKDRRVVAFGSDIGILVAVKP